jgi:hypothetical protein
MAGRGALAGERGAMRVGACEPRWGVLRGVRLLCGPKCHLQV